MDKYEAYMKRYNEAQSSGGFPSKPRLEDFIRKVASRPSPPPAAPAAPRVDLGAKPSHAGDHKSDHGGAGNKSSGKDVVLHTNVSCDGCGATPIQGVRYNCTLCKNYDLCSDCEESGRVTQGHLATHPMVKHKVLLDNRV